MAINVTLQTLATLNNQSILTQSNSNFSTLQTALLDCLSLSGQSPNQMKSTLDMNNNQIINLPPPSTVNSPARLVDVVTSGPPATAFGLLTGANTWTGLNTFIVTTVGSLPVATTIGAVAFVTDATATTFATIVAGGGANKVPVYSDGTNWRIG